MTLRPYCCSGGQIAYVKELFLDVVFLILPSFRTAYNVVRPACIRRY